jgi:hypothetical protein
MSIAFRISATARQSCRRRRRPGANKAFHRLSVRPSVRPSVRFGPVALSLCSKHFSLAPKKRRATRAMCDQKITLTPYTDSTVTRYIYGLTFCFHVCIFYAPLLLLLLRSLSLSLSLSIYLSLYLSLSLSLSLSLATFYEELHRVLETQP